MNTTMTMPTLEQIKPYLATVKVKRDCRPNWGSPDAGWIRSAMELSGFKEIAVDCWEDGMEDEKYGYLVDVDRFLMDDCLVDAKGIFITHDDGTYYHQIEDYRNVREKLDEVIRVAYVLADKSLLVSEGAVNSVAKSSFEWMLRDWRHGQSRPNHCIVTLTPIQWDNVCRMKSPQAFKGKPSRMYVHDPWVTAEIDEAVVWEVEVWQWEGDRHWTVDGKCVFVKEGTKPKYTADYPMDYWD